MKHAYLTKEDIKKAKEMKQITSEEVNELKKKVNCNPRPKKDFSSNSG